MPDNERFNVVLFGGTCRTTYIYMAWDSLVSIIIIIAKTTQQWFLILKKYTAIVLILKKCTGVVFD